MRADSPIIVRLQGGLGNQMYQYACGKAVAERLQRPLLLDTRTIAPEAYKRSYALKDLNIPERFVGGYNGWCVRWVGSVRLGRAFRMAWPPARRYSYIRDAERGFDSSVFNDRSGPIVLFGYWQSHRYFTEIEPLLRREFTFRRPPDARNASLHEAISSCDSVGVHIRRGDYVSCDLFSQTLGSLGAEYYAAAATFVQARLPLARYFVFSDEPDWVRQNLTLPGPMTVVDINRGRSDVDDLRLMAACRNFITANSSFSWWGAWLGASRSGLVVCPKTWFISDAVPPADRIPAHWQRL